MSAYDLLLRNDVGFAAIKTQESTAAPDPRRSATSHDSLPRPELRIAYRCKDTTSVR